MACSHVHALATCMPNNTAFLPLQVISSLGACVTVPRMDTSVLVSQYQSHLIDALATRIAATESAVGTIFGFDIQRHHATTLVVARHWPNLPQQLPFDRIYNYVASEADGTGDLLAYCAAAQIDALVEVEIAPDQRTEHRLHQYQFFPQWEIPWLHLDLAHFTPHPYPGIAIRTFSPAEMDICAGLFVQGYGYHGANAAAWRTFARYGYTGQGFHCFAAEVGQTLAGCGVLHIQGNTALVDGAATLPQFRGLGVQKALLTARIEHAREQGCTHAFSRTGAGSLSQRNMEKLGLREVYRTAAWRRSKGN